MPKFILLSVLCSQKYFRAIKKLIYWLNRNVLLNSRCDGRGEKYFEVLTLIIARNIIKVQEIRTLVHV